jgi:hypothetical protein
MQRLACWEVVATAVRRVARRAVRPTMAKVMVELGPSFALGWHAGVTTSRERTYVGDRI